MKVVILGGGLAGCTIGYLLSREGHEVIIVEQEMQLGGMCRTFYKDGLSYEIGPHIIYTNSEETISFMKRFIDIVHNVFYVGTYLENQFLTYPPHVEDIYRLKDNAKILEELHQLNHKEPDRTNFETYMMSLVGERLYKLFYYNYTKKFWGFEPKNLTAKWAATRDLSFIFNKDKRAFSAKYQGYPKTDYNDLITGLIKGCNIIKGKVDCFFDQPRVNGEFIKADFYISTIRLDDLFKKEFGELKFKGIRQEIEILNQEYYFPLISNFKKRFSWVYYPNNFKYTRICEYKNINLELSTKTLIAKEYPIDKVNHYPFYTEETEKIFYKYIDKISHLKNIITLGRLGLYIYTTMGNIIEMCFATKKFMEEYIKLSPQERIKRYQNIRAIARVGA